MPFRGQLARIFFPSFSRCGLRGALLNAPFSSLSQPLDIGRTTRTIPPHLRAAVTLRDRHCQFPGCRQPSSVCDVHHLIHWAHGGPTSLGNLALYCRFHHLIVIHRWGWKITRHPDGTTTATAPDGRTLHSHSPPQQAA
jgi:HNH endonuclease